MPDQSNFIDLSLRCLFSKQTFLAIRYKYSPQHHIHLFLLVAFQLKFLLLICMHMHILSEIDTAIWIYLYTHAHTLYPLSCQETTHFWCCLFIVLSEQCITPISMLREASRILCNLLVRKGFSRLQNGTCISLWIFNLFPQILCIYKVCHH